jgi:hypothetical protein
LPLERLYLVLAQSPESILTLSVRMNSVMRMLQEEYLRHAQLHLVVGLAEKGRLEIVLSNFDLLL